MKYKPYNSNIFYFSFKKLDKINFVNCDNNF